MEYKTHYYIFIIENDEEIGFQQASKNIAVGSSQIM